LLSEEAVLESLGSKPAAKSWYHTTTAARGLRRAEVELAEWQEEYQSCSEADVNWFKGKITGNPHISWENRWFPVDFP